MRMPLFLLMFIFFRGLVFGQENKPPYTVVKDSAAHTSVIHSGDAAVMKVRNAFGEKGMFEAIAPDVRIDNGIVDHKGANGDLYVREYFAKGKLIGYIQFDRKDKEREIYYNSKGDIYLEKRYDKGVVTYQNDSVRKSSVLSIPIKINHDNSAR